MLNLDYIKLNTDEIPLQPNGFLNILSNLTRTGVFVYQEISPDGTVRVIRQLRHPDDVFKEESMATLVGLPTTENHPKDLVTPENALNSIVGMSTDRPKRVPGVQFNGDKEEYIQQLVTFFNPAAIKKIVDGKKRELSLGYECELEEIAGEWNGIRYDYRQRDIKYNHLSLVDRARGGANCRVLMDSDDVEVEQHLICDGVSFGDNFNNDVDTEKEELMKVFLSDGKEYKVEDEAYELLIKLQKDSADKATLLSDSTKNLDTITAERDELKVKTEDGKAEEKSAKDKANFDSAVTKRVELVSKCVKILGDSEDVANLDDRAIKVKVIEKLRKDAKLDGVSDEYINARFDICVEDFKPVNKDEEILGKSNVEGKKDAVGGYEEARKKSFEDAKNQWKRK
jgi:hypothetical protein